MCPEIAAGTVKFFDPKRRFGFVGLENGSEVFIHERIVVAAGIKQFESGDGVTIEYRKREKGYNTVRICRHTPWFQRVDEFIVGQVVHYDPDYRRGFVRMTSKSKETFFFHTNALVSGAEVSGVEVGQSVLFLPGKDKQRRLCVLSMVLCNVEQLFVQEVEEPVQKLIAHAYAQAS